MTFDFVAANRTAWRSGYEIAHNFMRHCPLVQKGDRDAGTSGNHSRDPEPKHHSQREDPRDRSLPNVN
jgi:hypothetical protein